VLILLYLNVIQIHIFILYILTGIKARLGYEFLIKLSLENFELTKSIGASSLRIYDVLRLGGSVLILMNTPFEKLHRFCYILHAIQVFIQEDLIGLCSIGLFTLN